LRHVSLNWTAKLGSHSAQVLYNAGKQSPDMNSRHVETPCTCRIQSTECCSECLKAMWAGNGYDSIICRICTQIPEKYFLEMGPKFTNNCGRMKATNTVQPNSKHCSINLSTPDGGSKAIFWRWCTNRQIPPLSHETTQTICSSISYRRQIKLFSKSYCRQTEEE
jgi:hypothetical protein